MSNSGPKSRLDWFKLYTGRERKDAFRFPQTNHSVDKYVSGVKSRFPLINLGWADDGEVYITQEDRAGHMHVLGATQEGKSKLMELLIRDDIKNGYGCCLIDPSRGGATAYKVLRYCASIGFEKVVFIDPADMLSTGKIPAIQPLRDGIPEPVINGNLMDVTRVLWTADEFSKNPRIQKYLPAVIQTLVVNKLTLAEIRFFLSNVGYFSERDKFLANPELDDLNRKHIQGAFRNVMTFEHFQSTVNRMNPFHDALLRVLFGSRKTWKEPDRDEQHWGIPWTKLITEGWVILVNADPTDVWGHDNPVPQRLIATIIIGEVVHTIGRLIKRGWQGVYYLYIDEVGYYATRKLSSLLDYHAKTGLRLTMCHQGLDQVEDDKVLSSIRTNAKNKVLFHTPNTVDREIMMRDMNYGGDLPDRQVSYVLGQLLKGQAAVTVGKRRPRITRVRRIEDAVVDSKTLNSFKERIYSREWYYSKKEIEDEMNARAESTKSDGGVRISRRAFDKPTVGKSRGKARKTEDQGRSKSSPRGKVSDNSADSPPVLLSTQGRATRKIRKSEAEGE